MNTINFDELSKQIFEQNKAIGWWDDMDRCVYQTIQLISTEIAEATEGERKNLMDDKLKHRKMGEVELADALIRLLDMAGRYGWKIKPISSSTLAEIIVFLSKPKGTGGRHAIINVLISTITLAFLFDDTKDIDEVYSALVHCLLYVSSIENYDIIGAMHEKIEFNKNRPDHKRENRASENGKKF